MAQANQPAKLNRNQKLERAAKAKAAIVAFLNQSEEPQNIDTLHQQVLQSFDFDRKGADNLLRRMAANKQIASGKTAEGHVVFSPYTGAAPAAAGPVKRRRRRKLAPEATPSSKGRLEGRPEVSIEDDRLVIEHPRYRVVVELKP